jgi:hypothetical protein
MAVTGFGNRQWLISWLAARQVKNLRPCLSLTVLVDQFIKNIKAIAFF